MVQLTAAMAAFLALMHLLAGRIKTSDDGGKAPWLSLAGGASVAYVFVHILPDLCVGQNLIKNLNYPALAAFDHHIFLVALCGLVLFYGLDRLAVTVRRGQDDAPLGHSSPVFWIHLVFFALYNFLIAYLLLHRESPGPMNLFFFFTAMALHMAVNDSSLRRHFREAYEVTGRYVLAAAVLLGWTVGVLFAAHPPVLAALFAFLAGSVIMNVMKEEVPSERSVNFLGFLTGAVGYAALLLTL